VYTPMWHAPLPGWDVVDDKELLDRSDREVQEMAGNCTEEVLPILTGA